MERKIMLENIIKAMYRLTGGDEHASVCLKDIVYLVEHQLRDQGPISKVDELLQTTLQELRDTGLVQKSGEGYRLVAPEAKRRRSPRKSKSPMKNPTKTVSAVKMNPNDLSFFHNIPEVQPMPEKNCKLIREPTKKSVLQRGHPFSSRNPNMPLTLEHCDLAPKAELEHRQCSCSKKHTRKHQIRKPL